MTARGTASDLTPDDLRNQVSYLVRLIQITAYKSFEKTTRGFGTAPRYYGLLRLVEANPGITQIRLAEAIRLDRSSLVPILDTLERQGDLERFADPQDRRLRCIRLTAEGAARLGSLKTHVERHEAAMVEGLTGDEKQALVAMLQRVEANLAETPETSGHTATDKGAA